jgi:uncharacterized protein (DUF885 family)
LLLLLPALAVLAGCATVPAGEPPAGARLRDLYDEYFEESLQLSPLSATYLGDERYNDRLENPATLEYQLAAESLERRFLARARAIGPAGLQDSERISYDAFVNGRAQQLNGARFPEWLLPVNQMDSMASSIAVLGSGESAQPFRTVRDYENFLKRLDGFVAWSKSAQAAMRMGMRRGVVQPRVLMLKTVPQLRAVGVRDPRDSMFWKPVRSMPADFSAADRARLEAAYAEALATKVLPAYRRLADFIEKEYLPAARATIAWSALPDGAAWYNYRIATSTTTKLTADEIHQLGLAEVARIRGEMEQVRQQVGFSGDLHGFFRSLQTDPRFVAPSAASLLDDFRAMKQRIDGLLPAMFSDFPKADYEVREVEAFRARSAAGASYQAASADGKRPGTLYINTYNLAAQPLYGVETLSLHEAAPGHHFQISIQHELKDLPRFRRFGGNNAYAEGWALYCESIGKELGLFKDPYQWYGRLSDEMLRAMRLAVDTGMHAKGWSREQAMQFMADNSSMAASDIEAEVERYIAWPGQALAYKVGQLRMTAIRAHAEKMLGAKFDIKAFHSQVLRDGNLPLDVLEAKIERWIRSVNAQSVSR